MSGPDLDEWELLPIDVIPNPDDDGEARLYSPRRCFYSKSVVDMNYFECPPGNPPIAPPNEVIRFPASIVIDPTIGNRLLRSDSNQTFGGQIPRLAENEFVDMKLGDAMDNPRTPRMKQHEVEAAAMKGEADRGPEDVVWEEGDRGGLNMWKWGLNGIGAFCSFGVAAVTFCFLVHGSRNGKKHQRHSISFQIYTDDKRIKKIVHHANKLNEAISAVRGMPQTRAHIVVGGYLDGL